MKKSIDEILSDNAAYYEKLKQQGRVNKDSKFEDTETYKILMSKKRRSEYYNKNKDKINQRRRELRKIQGEVKPDNQGFNALYSGDFMGGFRGIKSIDYEIINNFMKKAKKFKGVIKYEKVTDENDFAKVFRFDSFVKYSMKLNDLIQMVFKDPDGAGSLGNALMSEVDKVYKYDKKTKTLFWYVEIRHILQQ